MSMEQRAPNILRTWAIFGGQMLLLHVLLIGGWMALEPQIRRNPSLTLILMAVYFAVFAMMAYFFARRLIAASAPPEIREALELGAPASAKVLEIRRTRWRRERYRNLRFQPRPARYEYVMRVRVSPPDGPEYEAEVAEFLSGENVPYKGDKIKVRIHPQNPDMVVMVTKDKFE